MMRRAAIVLLLLSGCSVDVQDGAGPRRPSPDVEGTVTRASSPAADVDVELHNVATDAKVFDTQSDPQGVFRFYAVPGGLWEVRAESNRSGDFASVRRQFYRADGDGKRRIALDIFGHGARPMAPVANATVTVPSPFAALDFHWSSPPDSGVLARVQLYDALGEDVWRSSWAVTDSARFYGYGTEGSYQGVPVGPGQYQWLVRFQFPDSTDARSHRIPVIFE
ncbi:MAG TPA: carboxypeptidase-like regulatory domain-containing protein [Candidatus Eisenbacteria bacterium]|nr:carboxypeptidase-like regulatory domain-containing protein [Candidatus Eisenbacteria bacterium]